MDYSKKARKLEALCDNRNSRLVWTEDCETAFKNMKEALTKTPVLGYSDLEKEFILDTDASFKAIGVVLSRKDDSSRKRVISHSLNEHEKGYCVTRKEFLAIY